MIVHLWQEILRGNSGTSLLVTFLLPQEFVLFSNHDALKFIYSQKKLNAKHGRWIEFLQDYTFTLLHKTRVKNKVVDALSRRIFILTKMSTVINGLKKIKTEYESCPDFCNITPF